MSPLPGIAGILLLLGAHATCAAAQVSNNVIVTEPNEAPRPAVADEFAITTNDHFAVQRRESSVDMRIDGRLDEAAWQDLQAHDDFRVIDPDTLEPASLPTEVVLFYTDKGLYVGARMTQDPDTLVEYLSGRDQGFLNRDYFSFTLDTSGEGRYGFWFQLNLGDTKSDGTILPERQYSSSWDGAWRGATARSDEGWSAEFFVPWSLVNMPKANGTRTMGIFAQRKVAHSDERHAWPPLPWTKPKFMSEFQQLALSEVSPRQQYGIIPYASAGYDRFGGGTTRRSGVDVFWRPSSNFQLTSTLNPDFGNVEADDVIVNLANYETFFPEKRPFFQKGQEIFHHQRPDEERPDGAAHAPDRRARGSPGSARWLGPFAVLARAAGRPARCHQGHGAAGLAALWLPGCDGGRSAVRRLAGHGAGDPARGWPGLRRRARSLRTFQQRLSFAGVSFDDGPAPAPQSLRQRHRRQLQEFGWTLAGCRPGDRFGCDGARQGRRRDCRSGLHAPAGNLALRVLGCVRQVHSAQRHGLPAPQRLPACGLQHVDLPVRSEAIPRVPAATFAPTGDGTPVAR